jgi:hypothetical protein
MSVKKKIIVKFVAPDSISWPRDMKCTNALLDKFPDESFWDWIEPFPIVQALFHLLSEKNLEYLNKKYLIFLSQKKIKEGKEKVKECLDQRHHQGYNLQESKVGEDLNLIKKPSTLKEFLNYGKTSKTN